jgi:hypothetical protein
MYQEQSPLRWTDTSTTRHRSPSRRISVRMESGEVIVQISRLFVDIKPGKVQAEYLTFQIEGGTRRPHLKAILVPTRESPKNKYGNVPRATRKRIIAGKGKFFSAGEREEKTPGVYRRQGERITPMAFYVESAEYKAIFPIDKIAGGVVKNRFGLRFDQALKRALATAR